MMNHPLLNLCRPLDRSREEDTVSTTTLENQRTWLAQRGYIPIDNNKGCRQQVRFAVVGDVHGQFLELKEALQEKCRQLDVKIDFVLQVGDIECHRDEVDLSSMAAPAKKRTLGDFWKVHQDKSYLDYPMYFIGGNHECYGWLDNEEHFRDSSNAGQSLQKTFLEVAPNIFYLGRAGYLPLRFFHRATAPTDDLVIAGILNLGFLSGIHRPEDFYHRRPPMTADILSNESNKRWIGFNVYDTQLLVEDEVDDGVDHFDNSYNTRTEALPTKHRQLVLALATILGVHLDAEGDVLLSTADVAFLTRYLIPAAPGSKVEDIESKRRNSTRNLPRSLNSICQHILKGLSAQDFEKLMNVKLKRRRNVDVFLSHDWPAGVAEGMAQQVVGNRSRPVGNAVCREVTQSLKPKLHCCGHMHYSFRTLMKHTTPHGKPSEKTTELCCVGKVGLSGPAAIAIFEFDLETGSIVELQDHNRLAD